MQHQTKRHQHPRQIRRREDEQPQEAQPRLWVPSRPDVDQSAAQCASQEGHGQERGGEQEDGGGEEEEPGEVRWGAAGGFLEEAGVALEEEDVEEEIEGEGAEVEEGG